MITRQDLTIYQGDDFLQSVPIPNPPADLNAYTARAQIRRGAADYTPLVAEMVVSLSPGPPPVINLLLPRRLSATMFGYYVWDLKMIAADGGVSALLGGRIQVIQEVTRTTDVVQLRRAYISPFAVVILKE
jgi:hypothetical protein